MGRVASRTAALGGMALFAVVLAGCTKSGDSAGGAAAKIDLAQVEDNQVALDVEGMV